MPDHDDLFIGLYAFIFISKGMESSCSVAEQGADKIDPPILVCLTWPKAFHKRIYSLIDRSVVGEGRQDLPEISGGELLDGGHYNFLFNVYLTCSDLPFLVIEKTLRHSGQLVDPSSTLSVGQPQDGQ